MAKRRAEAVACRAPCQLRAFPRAPPPPPKRSRSDLERRESRGAALWRENGGVKRKWTVVAEGGDEAGAGGKRLAEGTARREPEQRLPVVAGMATEAAALAGGDATAGQGGPEKPEDDVWHYNSFQFWKLPLPTIDLSDIQELEKGSITETRSSSNTSLSEMET